ncbi:hypothetical protein B0J14DRAFT_493296, partial [Halenospora varia]
DSGIYLCNDNRYTITPSCQYIASYASDITTTCHISGGRQGSSCGEHFDTDNYNVIVHSDSC